MPTGLIVIQLVDNIEQSIQLFRQGVLELRKPIAVVLLFRWLLVPQLLVVIQVAPVGGLVNKVDLKVALALLRRVALKLVGRKKALVFLARMPLPQPLW